jgi:hypothetical protein
MDVMTALVEPGSIVSIVVVLVTFFWVFRIIFRVARRVRSRADNMSRASQMLNELPSELRFRVFERDSYMCQECGAGTDMIVTFVDDPPDEPPVLLDDLVTRCTRCAAISRESGKID